MKVVATAGADLSLQVCDPAKRDTHSTRNGSLRELADQKGLRQPLKATEFSGKAGHAWDLIFARHLP